MAADALLSIMLVKLLEEEERSHRGRKNPEIDKRWERKGSFNDIVKELRLEDTKGYEEMTRMDFDAFKFILMKIEKDIIPIE